ncbi:tRNA epoxyqueuosine(34) reductase QueG [uncultured Paludibaculum sp.]|uniref:tRNA epoxyqueuosine(34) reductase QueG n=1 Tax=uncultured Paludibaculum sp. TaxID=1765020 RepID=UPI002AAC28F9|nr:tRNA epoxyqueuosine(34) reductase QueG [uncultured Paludibaculum sp.]
MIREEILPIPHTPDRALLAAAAQRAGFALHGVAKAEPLADYRVYQQWVSDGMAGPMAYLTDHRGTLRSDPRSLLPSARSVLCVGRLYNTEGPPDSGVSRYAWGSEDYHDVLRRALQGMVDELLSAWGSFEYRICVDTAPLLERSLARQAGLGWIGRNTCLINQPAGSWFFLAEVLISLELAPDSPPPDRCGTCRRCIDACPTQALVPDGAGGWRLDGRACISTWTIEQHGVLPEEHRAASGQHLFGCDICQDVCPWNRRAPVTQEAEFQPVNADPDPAELAALSPEEFRARFRKTPLWRTRYAGLLRNVATVLGNTGDSRYLEPLRRLASNEDEAVRIHAEWAVRRLEDGP